MANIKTPVGRLSYPHLFEAQTYEDGEPKFNIVLLFKKGEDLSALEAMAATAAKEKWGDKIPAGLRNPFRDQSEKADEQTGALPAGYEDGAKFMTLSSKHKPGVVNTKVGADGKLETLYDDTDIYAGCWVRASVSCYAYAKKGNKGVSFGLRNVQLIEEGERLDGGVKAEDDFEPVAGAGEPSATSIFG